MTITSQTSGDTGHRRDSDCSSDGGGGYSYWQKRTTYVIHVQTGDRFNAGTSANVRLILIGDRSSEILPLTHRQRLANFGQFERYRRDEFIFRDVPSLGVLKEVRIWHDNRGVSASWLLEYVEVSDTALRQKFRFPCHKWLRKTRTEDTTSMSLRCTEVTRGPGSAIQPALGVLKAMDELVKRALQTTTTILLQESSVNIA